MAFELLDDEEKQIVLQCMKLMYEEQYIGDWEFPARFGMSRKELQDTIHRWPYLEDRDEKTMAAINNSMNEVLHGVRIPRKVWSKWFDVPWSEVKVVYHKWARLKGFSSTGLM